MLIGLLVLCYFLIGLLIAFVLFREIDTSGFEIFSTVLLWPVAVASILIRLILIGLSGFALRIKNKIKALWYSSTREEN